MNRSDLYKLILFSGIFLVAGREARCQSQSADQLKTDFVDYQAHNYQEKIFVHMDRPSYLAGEIIWFKLYCVDAYFNKPSGISKLAYVELVNDEQKPVLQAKIVLQDGAGAGSLVIPFSVNSGRYRLRAYTSRMKNFDAAFYFEQTITVINTLKSAAQSPSPKSVYRIDFFPEGGNLVEGLSSRIGWKVADQFGHGHDAKAVILNSKQDTVARMTTTNLGMGSFDLSPAAGEHYAALVQVGDTAIRQELPNAYASGYVMSLEEEGANIKLTVKAAGQQAGAALYLLAHTRQVLKEFMSGKITDNKTVFLLDRAKLADGISDITLFDVNRRPVCERLYFKRPTDKLLINVRTDNTDYTTRKKIKLDLSSSNMSGQPADADMSIAVYKLDSLTSGQTEDITAWMLLQSDLAGKIESPGYYLRDSSADARKALDDLLLTQGWRRFKWDDLLAHRSPVLEFATEYEGPVIISQLTDKATGQPKRNTLATLTSPGNLFSLQAARSGEDGKVVFRTNSFYSNELIVETPDAADSSVRIVIASPFSDRFNREPIIPLQVSSGWQSMLAQRSIEVQADNAYQLEKKRFTFLNANADTNAFYGYPEKRYNLDEYTRFVTMEEVLREFVLDLRVRKQADKFQFRVVNATFKDFFDADPLVLVDGVPVSDINKVMSLDPLQIRTIDVATHRHYLGPLVCDGVVAFRTYQGDLGGYQLDANAVVVEYAGLQRQREYYSPSYETPEQAASRVPDFRNLLYWQPFARSGVTGKTAFSFFSSDLEGQFLVVTQGMTAEGVFGSSATKINVGK